MGVIGGGLLVAVAAALWIAYLMPIWLRRRQYLATERNAVRLQQTLRILAETAETPEPVVIEATARQVALHQRVLREQERTARLEAQTTERLAIAERRVAEAAAEAAADAVAHAAPPTEPIEVPAPDAASTATAAPATGRPASRRVLRRRRALCSLLLLAGLLMLAGGLVALAFEASPLIAVAGASVAALALTALVRLARERSVAPVAAPVARPAAEPFVPVELSPEAEGDAGWTPRPLPKPLTLSRGTIAATAMASIEAAAELQRLAQEADRAKRIDELASPMPTIAPAARSAQPARAAQADAAPEAASPYAGMGVVGEPQRRFGDLDAVLQRRRKVG